MPNDVGPCLEWLSAAAHQRPHCWRQLRSRAPVPRVRHSIWRRHVRGSRGAIGNIMAIISLDSRIPQMEGAFPGERITLS
jgi:hypothetical protein